MLEREFCLKMYTPKLLKLRSLYVQVLYILSGCGDDYLDGYEYEEVLKSGQKWCDAALAL